ncbi:hypothetical protein NMU03_01500 [Allocoprobacillus halotolerans]|uniref:Uncharacterized protein n=1 Tax=Allocoprobacillus halotolerans TaxID=2944914 RepID=A0ABY5I671_9FIRM|nr:hypothetical protein [Allocoprobacillus halotolerans]UTY39538.1 hypothetical protein NMU03_01500 [Allocoprobacillus halotolerans]
MKVVIDKSVFLFLKENKIKLSQQLKTVISHLKLNPKMYAIIANDDCIRHFIIKGIDFGYMIDDGVVIISDCRFVKSNTKLKVR